MPKCSEYYYDKTRFIHVKLLTLNNNIAGKSGENPGQCRYGDLDQQVSPSTAFDLKSPEQEHSIFCPLLDDETRGYFLWP